MPALNAIRSRPPRNMAVHPLHGIGGRKRQSAGEHLVEGDAKGVEVAAGVDRPVHAPGLLGGHVGERAGDGLGRLGRLALAGEARGDAEPGEPHLSARAVHQNIGRLDVLVDEATLVDLVHRRRDAGRKAQEASHVHGGDELPLERLAARILGHQHSPTAVAHKRQRAGG